jgi:hypothetical protein
MPYVDAEGYTILEGYEVTGLLGGVTYTFLALGVGANIQSLECDKITLDNYTEERSIAAPATSFVYGPVKYKIFEK